MLLKASLILALLKKEPGKINGDILNHLPGGHNPIKPRIRLLVKAMF